jgi:hypothetical protein
MGQDPEAPPQYLPVGLGVGSRSNLIFTTDQMVQEGGGDVKHVIPIHDDGLRDRFPSRITAFYGSTAQFYTTPAGVRTCVEVLPLSYQRSDHAVPHVVRLGDSAMAATGEVVFYREEPDGTETALPFRMTHVLVRRRCAGRCAGRR